MKTVRVAGVMVRGLVEDPQGALRAVRFSSASLFQRTPTGWKVLASNLFYPPEGEG